MVRNAVRNAFTRCESDQFWRLHHEFLQFDQLGRFGPAASRCGARAGTQFRARSGGQFQGGVAGATQQARSREPPGVRRPSGPPGTDADGARGARGAFEGARIEADAAISDAVSRSPGAGSSYLLSETM